MTPSGQAIRDILQDQITPPPGAWQWTFNGLDVAHMVRIPDPVTRLYVDGRSPWRLHLFAETRFGRYRITMGKRIRARRMKW
jgi:hypothetical protein